MAFRKTSNGVEHDQPAGTEVEAEIREFVRRDVMTNRERQPENESEMVANSINSLLQRTAAANSSIGLSAAASRRTSLFGT